MKSWKYPEPSQPKWLEFMEWFVPLLLWFPSCIGGWLVGFELMSPAMMGITAIIISTTGAWYFTFKSPH